MLRGLPGPVFFPIRALAVVYADLFRGVPTILVIYILGFGVPALGLPGVPTRPALLGDRRRSCSSTRRTSPRSTGPASSRCTRARTAAARSLGLSHAQALRFVVIPQAVRRVIPPLLNDFIGLQKDTALVGLLGVVEAFRQSQIDVAGDVQLHAVHRDGAPLHRAHDPAGPLHRLARRARPAAPASRTARVSTENGRALAHRGPAQVVRQARGAARHRPELAEHEVVCLIGASGSGKSTLLRCVNLLEPIDAGRIVARRRGDHRAGRRRERACGAGSGSSSSRSTSSRTCPCSATSRSAPRKALGLSARPTPRRARTSCSAASASRTSASEYPDRLSGGQQQRVAIVRALAMQPGPHAARRGHERARPRARRRGARGHPRARRATG